MNSKPKPCKRSCSIPRPASTGTNCVPFSIKRCCGSSRPIAKPFCCAISKTVHWPKSAPGLGTWKMNTLKLSFIGAVIIAAVAAPWFIQHQAQAKLRAENDSLRTQLQQIAILTRENAHLSNLVAQAERTQAEMAKQLKDLPRLRGEAGAL